MNMKYISTWETLQCHHFQPEQARDPYTGQEEAENWFSFGTKLDKGHSLYTSSCSKWQELLGLPGFNDTFKAGMYVDCSLGKLPAPSSFLYSSCSGMPFPRHPICKTHTALESLHMCSIYSCSTWQ